MPADGGRAGDLPDTGCGECSPIPHEGGYGRCECECHDAPKAEACGFCNLGVYDWKGSLIACPYCDGTGVVQ